MIIDRSFFNGDIHIPNAQDTAPNSDLLGNSAKIDAFIDIYEEEALTKCLGSSLYTEFIKQLDHSKPNGLKDGASDKWDYLLNGREYQIDGFNAKWRGLVFKNGKAKQSLIAYYVYYHFLLDDIETFTGIGIKQEKGKNSVGVSPIPKSVRAWRKFYNLTVGNYCSPSFIYKPHGIGVDWMQSNSSVRSLYQFVRDANYSEKDTYENWNPSHIENENNFGI